MKINLILLLPAHGAVQILNHISADAQIHLGIGQQSQLICQMELSHSHPYGLALQGQRTLPVCLLGRTGVGGLALMSKK